MKGSLVLILGLLAWTSPSPADAQEFVTRYAFEGPPFRVVAPPGETALVESFATVEIVNTPGEDWLEGLSMSILVEGANVVSLDTDGLFVETRSGESLPVSDSWFIVISHAEDPNDASRRGAVFAIVGPGYPGPHEFFATDPLPILRLTLEVEMPESGEDFDVRLAYENGLQGFGQPVENQATRLGVTIDPEVESLEFLVTSEEALFVRGDSNRDARHDISDPIFILRYLFSGSVETPCPPSLDANDDGRLNITDAVNLFEYLFRGGASLPPPLDDCGADPTADDLLCHDFGGRCV